MGYLVCSSFDQPVARILVIDDEVTIRDAIRLILEQRGHRVVAAECGQRGVEAIEAFAFDAVIVDIFMPGMDGFQTIRILRQSAPKVAIIAISGYAFREASWPVPDFLKMACDLGATHCLRKPFKAWEIIKARSRRPARVCRPQEEWPRTPAFLRLIAPIRSARLELRAPRPAGARARTSLCFIERTLCTHGVSLPRAGGEREA
jgi:CheY-like chemotaxis protein